MVTYVENLLYWKIGWVITYIYISICIQYIDIYIIYIHDMCGSFIRRSPSWASDSRTIWSSWSSWRENTAQRCSQTCSASPRPLHRPPQTTPAASTPTDHSARRQLWEGLWSPVRKAFLHYSPQESLLHRVSVPPEGNWLDIAPIVIVLM